MKFNHLNVPDHWQHYWSRYPEGYTILEALISWVSQVDDMVDNVNEWNNYLDDFVIKFDTELQQTVTDILSDWQTTGFLDFVINEALDTKYHEMDERINATKADKTELQTGLNSKVDKAGNEQVSWGMLDQTVKENITGGNTAVVGTNSVNTNNIVNNAVTSEKRTVAGNLPLIIIGGSGVLPNYDTSEQKLEMNSGVFIVVGKTRYQISANTVVDCSTPLSSYVNCVVLFDTSTRLLRANDSSSLPVNMTENDVIVATISYTANHTSLLDININCRYTVDNLPQITTSDRTSLGELPLITKGASGGLIDFDTATTTLNFEATGFLFHRDKRYTIPSGTVVDCKTGDSGVVIYYDLATGELYSRGQTKLTDITESSIIIGIVYMAQGEWSLLMNADYTIDGKPKYMPYNETIEAGILPYQFSVEKLTGDFPESNLPGVGEEGNPFNRTNDDYTLVYSLFDDLMDSNSNYITREEIGRSTNDVPIYCYHFTPEITPVTAGPLLKPYPKVIMDSSIHGGENLGTDALYFLFKRICEDWQNDKGLEYLRHYVNFAIVPLPNPEDYTSKQYIGIDGVNLNRDFDFDWQQSEGTGTTAFSRVEAQVMRDFFFANDDALLFVNCHVRGGAVTDDSETMWLGSSNVRETPILSNTIEKMTRKWKEKYPALQNVGGQLGHITTRDGSGTIKSYVHHVVGINSILWEGFKATPTMNDFEGKDVVDMNVQFLGETLFNIVKNYQ